MMYMMRTQIQLVRSAHKKSHNAHGRVKSQGSARACLCVLACLCARARVNSLTLMTCL